MVSLITQIKKFGRQGEKTGWTYIDIPFATATQLKAGCKKSFRVKGKLDQLKIEAVAILPMGEGNFILPINAAFRKALQKKAGDTIEVYLQADDRQLEPPADLIICLKDEPEAFLFFKKLAKGHQNYFSKWINSAKTKETRTNRIAQTVSAMLAGKDYGAMLRLLKKDKQTR